MSGRHASDTGGGRDWKRRAITIAAALVALVLGYLAAAAFIPRWWSHRIGDAASGKFSTGILLGFCFGTVFTIMPLGLLWLTMRRPMRWKTRLYWLLLGVVLALPNLFTLGVAVGSGNAAHAGQRTMDVDAPGFRGATLVGALFAVLAVLAMVIVYRRRGPVPRKSKAPAPT